MDVAILERLAASEINLLPIDLDRHYMFERDGFVALVEKRGDGFGAVGAAGLLTQSGLAPLVWRGDSPVFITRTSALDATQEQISSLRAFQSDLENAIRG